MENSPFHSDVLEVLNASCGDILKAHVLNANFGFSINALTLRAPTGDLERAFADSRAHLVASESMTIGKSAETALHAFRADHRERPTTETLPKMPDGMKFEDTDPEKEAETAFTEVVSAAQHEGEIDIDGIVYVTPIRAAELRGACSMAVISTMASMKKWSKLKHAIHGRIYAKADVLAVPVRRKRSGNHE